MKKYTHTEAFEFYGTSPRNVQWSWSALNEETKTVVVTLWQNEFSRKDGVTVYERSERGKWAKGPGYRDFLAHLVWAKLHCNGVVRLIIAIPNSSGTGKKIKECFPKEALRMRVVSVEETSGAFALEQVA